jgi:glycosyltransferase involved in cell wall biosynthesis
MSEEKTPRLLLVGPLPPPPTGTTVTFKIFVDELDRLAGSGHHTVVDSSPKGLKKSFRIVSGANLRKALAIAVEFRRHLRSADQVMVFGSNGFLLSMAPILLVMARRARRPFFLRAFGGSLDNFYSGLNPIARRLLRWTLQHADGVSVQTGLLLQSLKPMLGDRVHKAPGYRYMPRESAGQPDTELQSSEPLRLVYVGLIREDKGVFVLLEALRRLDDRVRETVQCDLYGPLYDFAAERLQSELERTPNAAYRGVLEPERVVATMRAYEVLAFPSFYQGEGHPGVVIESMMAGLAVITTDFRSIPEVVENGVNGLLVPPHDPEQLKAAIERLHDDRRLLTELRRHNWERRTRFDAREVLPQLIQQMGVDPSTLGD